MLTFTGPRWERGELQSSQRRWYCLLNNWCCSCGNGAGLLCVFQSILEASWKIGICLFLRLGVWIFTWVCDLTEGQNKGFLFSWDEIYCCVLQVVLHSTYNLGHKCWHSLDALTFLSIFMATYCSRRLYLLPLPLSNAMLCSPRVILSHQQQHWYRVGEGG